MPLDYKQLTTEILSRIQDPQLKTFDVIFKPESDGASPVICIEQNLGIESWCIKDLYMTLYNSVFKKTAVPDPVTYEASDLILLLLNHNIKSLWNKRRRLMLDNKSDLDFELHFIRLVLSYKPKAQDAYNYRKWLIREFKGKLNVEFVEKEYQVILQAASQHKNNHMAWDYGIWLLNSTTNETLALILVELWNKTINWVNSNISDYSGLHFRQFLVKKLISKDIIPLVDYSFKKQIMLTGLEFIGSVLNIFDENVVIECCQKFETPEYSGFYIVGILLAEFELNESLILFYCDHEALWNHRRFICHYFLSFLPQILSNESRKLFSSLVKNILIVSANISQVNETNLFEFLFFKIHYSFLDKCNNFENQCYSKRYTDWLKKSGLMKFK